MLSNKQKQWVIIGIATAAVLVTFSYKFYTSLVPTLSEKISDQVPDVIVEEIGESALRNLDQNTFSPSNLNKETKQRIRQRFQDNNETLGIDNDDYRLLFRSWEAGPNAIALSDGTLILTDDIVELLNHNPRLIDAILLHEVAHVEYRHHLESLVRNSLFYLSISLLFGDISLVTDLIVEATAKGVELGYSREFEFESDGFAAEKLKVLYGSSDSLAKALTLLAEQTEENEELSWFSTHPAVMDRIANIRE